MNRKEELLSKIRELSKKIGSVKVYFNEYKTGGNDGMGYYFDEKDKLWKSYVCGNYNFITSKSKNEIDVIEYLYNSVRDEAEAHDHPLEKIRELERNLRCVPVWLNDRSIGAFAIGYFYDPEVNKWATYHNDERGSSLYYYYDCEEDAIVEVYKMVSVEYKLQHG